MTDAELVAHARQGDASAFGELVDRHRGAVFRAALAALGSRADAEDAAQDAFVLAFRRLGGFRGDASFKTWLLTITWHAAINRRRSLIGLWKRITDPKPDDEPIVESVADTASSPEQLAIDRRLSLAIRDAIRDLPRSLRDTLLLVQSGEHTYDEIGAMLGAPLGTIKWRVSEARRKVRAQLLEKGFGDVVRR